MQKPSILKITFKKLFLINTNPIPTPNRCKAAVPDENPTANNIGFAAQGISIPWAIP